MFLFTLIVTNIAAVFTMFLGIRAYLEKPKGPMGPIIRSFCFMMFVGSTWAILAALKPYLISIGIIPLIPVRLLFIFGGPNLAALLVFSLHFPKAKNNIGPFYEFLIYLPFIVFGVLGSLGYITYNNRIINNEYLYDGGQRLKIFNYTVAIYLIAAISTFIWRYNIIKSKNDKLRMKWIASGFTCTFTSILIFSIFFPQVFNNKTYWILGPLSILFSAFTMYYATIKHRLLNISIFIKKSIVYSLVLFCVITVYSVATILIPKVLNINITFPTVIIISLIVVFGLPRLEDFFSKITDKFFFKARLDYTSLISKFSSNISNLIDIETLSSEINQFLINDLKIKSVEQFLLCCKDNQFYLFNGRIKKKQSEMDYICKYFLESEKEIIAFDELKNLQFNYNNKKHVLLNEILKCMKKNQIKLILPLSIKNSLLGYISLQEKKSDDPYFKNDFHYLNIIKNQISMCLEKIKHIEEEKQFAIQIAEAKTREMHLQKEVNLEKKLSQAKKLEAIGTLAGGVAHDLNNILSGLVGYPDIILHDMNKNDPNYELIQTIKKSGEKASYVVQDLLTLTRRGAITFNKTKINNVINDLKESPENIKLLKNHKNVKISYDLSKNLPDISGSEVHLSKCFFNLISNAAEAINKEHGVIKISTTSEFLHHPVPGYSKVEKGNYVCITISDNGEGISEENKRKVFEPFFTTKKMGKTSGTGLGLAVVYGAITDHNGYLLISSKVKLGTTFKLYFPEAPPGDHQEIVKVSGLERIEKEYNA